MAAHSPFASAFKKFQNTWFGAPKRRPIRRAPERRLDLRLEELESRVTPDATALFGAYSLRAIGDTAIFESLYQSEFNLAPKPIASSFGGGSQLHVLKTTSPVEVSKAGSNTNQVLFTLPEGGQFRTNGSGGDYSPISYADIVPRYGLITVANGLPANTTFAQQQRLTLTPALTGSSSFTLTWNGQTTTSLSMNASADTVQAALNSLSNIGGVGGTVDVAKDEGRTFTITFGGTLFSKPALITAQATGFLASSTITPVTQVYLTKRDTSAAAANSDGFQSFLLPLVNNDTVSEMYSGTRPNISQFIDRSSPTTFWAIPSNLATTFPTSQSPAFTPTHFGLYPDPVTRDYRGNYPATTKWEVRLLGNMEFPTAFVGSVQVGNAALQTTANQRGNTGTSDIGFARQIPSANGFSLVAPNSSSLNVLSAGVDNAGNPRPITFSFGGLNFSVDKSTAPSLNYNSASNSLTLTSGTSYHATAPFLGGELMLRFNELTIDLDNGSISVGTPGLMKFQFGGFEIYGGRDASIAYDAAATKFTLTITAQVVSSESVASFDTRFGLVDAYNPARRPDPMKISLGAGTMTITKGVLDPITNYPVTGFSIGRSDPTFNFGKTTYLPYTPNTPGSLSLMYTAANTYNFDKTVKLPANSVGIYGTAKTNLSVAGVTIPGTVNLGSRSASPGLVITSGSLNRLVFPIAEVKTGGFTFTGTYVNSALPLMASYYPPLSLTENPSYVITGGAVMKKDGTVFSGDAQTIFGGNGTEGLKIYPKESRFTFNFGLANTFPAGTNGIQPAEGPDGLKVEYNPTSKIYNVRGDAFVYMGASRLAVTATTPPGVSGFDSNPLNATSLNLFVKDGLTVNGFTLTPLATANPLRLIVKPTTTELTGDFSMRLEGYELAGTVSPVLLTTGAFPAAGLNLNWDQVGGGPRTWVLGGVLLSGLSPGTLTDQLRLPFKTSTFEGQPLATGALGAEPNIVTARNGRGETAVIKNAGSQQVGDVKFNNFTATFQFQTTPQAWVFSGPGSYFGKTVTAGGTGNASVKIGGNATTGYQLSLGNTPAPPAPTPDLPPPSTLTLSGVTFEIGKWTQTAVNTVSDGKVYTYSFPEYTVRIGRTDLTLVGQATIKVTLAGAQITTFSATAKQNSAFTIGNASFQVNNLTVAYDFTDKAFKISGSAKFTYKAAGSNVDMDVTMGDAAEPGLIIKDGAVQSLKVSVSGTFTFMKLTATVPEAKALTLEYNRADQAYLIYGKVLLSTASQNSIKVIDRLSVSLGSGADKPGIRIASGSVESVDIAINGNINLFSLKATPKNLRLRYTAETNQLQITGGVEVTLANGMVLKAGLPGKGLLIDTATGKVQIRGVSLASDGDINFGALKIKNLKVLYADDGTNVTISAGADLIMPSGLEVGGSFKLVNGALDSIAISLTKNPGILVAGGLVNIYSISGSIEGLTDLNNFKLKATVKASVGPAISFAGKTYALADVTGSITVTKDNLTLDGNVDLVGGLLGNGTFKGVISWGSDPAKVTFDATVQLYPGGIVRGKISAYVDLAGNVDFSASIGAYAPRGLPIVGDQSLGNVTIELRIRPAEAPANSYVSFDLQILNVGGGIKANFDANVDYNLRADFGFFKVRKRGTFSLRDALEAPTVQIVSASAIPGTPNGEIVVTATTPFPETTVIDIYADTNGDGNDGLLIGSVAYQSGNQTIVWKDMAAFAAPGQTVYVYAVANDTQGMRGFSTYSNSFTTEPGFAPEITVPNPQSFSPRGSVQFSTVNDNIVAVDDPRLASDPESVIQVTIEVGGGTLDFTHASDTVAYTGVGTNRVVLQGNALEIRDLLDGLTYTPMAGSILDDELTVRASFLPLQNLAGEVTATVPLEIQRLTLSLLASSFDHDNDPTVIRQNAVGARPLQTLLVEDIASSFITGARVSIDGYTPGVDLLGFAIADERATGLRSSFNPTTGVLSLTGFGTLGQYQDALRRVTFFTSGTAINQSLIVQVGDDHGDLGSLVVPLTIRASVAAPVLNVGTSGVKFVQGMPATAMAPTASIVVPLGASVTGATIAFAGGTYQAGEDILSYAGSGIAGAFDAATGVFTLSGTASAADYALALQQVFYQAQGGSVTEGLRNLVVTVTDDAVENTTAEARIVIGVSAAARTYNGPTFVLSTNHTSLATDLQWDALDPNLTLTADVPTLTGATVTITSGFIPGKDALGVADLPDGIEVSFDPATATLHLTGVALVADYQHVLRSVLLAELDRSRAANRTLTVAFNVKDGLGPIASQSLTVDIARAPYLDANLGNVLLYTQGQSTVAIDMGFTIDFPASLSGAQVAIFAGFETAEDQLLFTDQNGIHGVFDSNTGVLTLTGTASTTHYQAALESIQYRNSRHNPSTGDRIVSYQVFDGVAASNIAKSAITVAPLAVGPTIAVTPLAPTFIEDGPAGPAAPNFTLTAADATTTLLSASQDLYRVEIVIGGYVASEDLLAFTDQNNIVGLWDPIEGRLILSGDDTLDNYQAAIRSITYVNLSHAPLTTPRTITVHLLGLSANGLTDQASTTLNFQAIAEPPVLSAGSAPTVNVLQNAAAASLNLGALQFAPAAGVDPATVVLMFTPTHLPPESLGKILLTDGTPLTLGAHYPIGLLAELQLSPTSRGMGSDSFTFNVAATDPFTGNLDAGILGQTIAIAVQGIQTATASEAYVSQLFRDLQNLNADAATLNAWVGNLNGKLAAADPGVIGQTAARASFAAEFLRLDAFAINRIDTIYQSLLGRDAAPSEIAVELASLNAGGTFADVRVNLAGSNEYAQLHNASGYRSFVEALFQDLLGRAATDAESTRWIANLQTGGGTLTSVARAIGAMPEAAPHVAEELIQSLLRRIPTADDQSTYDFTSANETALIRDIVSSQEYYARYATPTTARTIANQATSGYSSVGKLGDAAGDKAGGTLIAPQYVLVAAHSVANISPGQLTFTIGGVQRRVAEVFIHPDYNPRALGSEGANDLALLKLDQPINDIAPSRLLNAPPVVGEMLTLVGFGERGGTPYGVKRVGTTPAVNQVTSTAFTWRFDDPTDTSSAPGDSGSPLFITINGIDFIVGLVSGGTNPAASLGDVATNTRIDAYLAWIQTFTGPLTTGNYQPASLSGHVGYDPSTVPQGLQGVVVFVDNNGNGQRDDGEASTTVSPDGSFAFAALDTCLYLVRAELPADRRNFVGSYGRTVMLSSGDAATGIELTLQPNTPSFWRPLEVAPPRLFGAYTGQQDRDYIDDLYRALLGRNVDDVGLAAFSSQLASGASRADIGNAIVNSAEYRTSLIRNFYITILGREAEASGVTEWLKAMSIGMGERDVLVGFLSSDEFIGGRSQTDFINSLYVTALKRQGDADGIAYWAALLDRGVAHKEIVRAIITSTEYGRAAAQEFYSVYLVRQTKAWEIDSWTDLIVSDKSNTSIAVSFLASPEFYNKLRA